MTLDWLGNPMRNILHITQIPNQPNLAKWFQFSPFSNHFPRISAATWNLNMECIIFLLERCFCDQGLALPHQAFNMDDVMLILGLTHFLNICSFVDREIIWKVNRISDTFQGNSKLPRRWVDQHCWLLKWKKQELLASWHLKLAWDGNVRELYCPQSILGSLGQA